MTWQVKEENIQIAIPTNIWNPLIIVKVRMKTITEYFIILIKIAKKYKCLILHIREDVEDTGLCSWWGCKVVQPFCNIVKLNVCPVTQSSHAYIT